MPRPDDVVPASLGDLNDRIPPDGAGSAPLRDHPERMPASRGDAVDEQFLAVSEVDGHAVRAG